MITKDEFVHTMRARLDKWNAEIDALSTKADQAARQAEVEAQAEYRKQLEVLRSKRDAARSMLNELESAGENAWHDLKTGVELAWESVSEAVRSATARFK